MNQQHDAMMYRRILSTLALALSIGAAHAAADPMLSPTASTIDPTSFEAYSRKTRVGDAKVDEGAVQRAFAAPVTAVPEPATCVLLATALVAMELMVRRRKP